MTEAAATATPATDEQVPVWTPEGDLKTIARADVSRATSYTGGFKLASPEDVRQAKLQAEYGTTGGVAAASGLGLARGLTFGLSDAAISGFGGAKASQAVEGYREANPTASTGFELAGMVAPTLLSGGAAAPEEALSLARAARGATRLAGIVPRGVAAAGEAAEGLAARSLTGLAERGALGQAAATGLKVGARGAVEGALYGGVHEMSEEMLGDHELNAEKIIAAAGEQGAAGAILGFGLGGAGSLAASGAKGLKGLALSKLAENSSVLRGAADEQAFRAANVPKSVAKEAEARFKPVKVGDEELAGGSRGLGEVSKKYGLIGDDWQQAAREGHPEAQLPKVQAALEKVGDEIGSIHTASPAVVNSAELLGRIESEVIAPLRGKAGFEPVVTSLDAYKDSLRTHLGVAAEHKMVPVQEVIAQRKALDDLVFRESKALDPNLRVGFMRQIRGEMQTHIYEAMTEAAAKAGNPESVQRLKVLAHDYQGLSLLEKGLESSSAGYQSNRTAGLTDYLSGSAGSKVGATVGGFAGPVGAFIGGVAGGAVGGVVNKIVRERGNAVTSHLLSKLADFAEMQAAIKQVDAQVAKSAKGIVAMSAEKPKVAAKAKTVKEPKADPVAARYRRAVEQSVKAESDSRGVVESLTKNPIQNAPKTSAAVATSLMRTATYLSSSRPETLTQPVIGQIPRPAVDDVTAAAYLRTHEAAVDPMSALKQFERGKVTPEAVATLQAVSPKLFEQLQRETLTVITEKSAAGKPVPFNTRLKLGILLGIETDPALNPKMLESMQTSLDTPPSDAGPKPRSQPVNLKSTATGLDRLENK